jgi:hypothetical protein
MSNQSRFLLSDFAIRGYVRFLAFGLGLYILTLALALPGRAQDPIPYIPATEAFNNSPTCSASDLSSFARDTDLARANPEWKPIKPLNIDSNHPFPNNDITVLEGFVTHPPPACTPLGGLPCENSGSQSTSEVAEEDIPWTHYTHDFTFKVTPDTNYQHLLSSWTNADGSSNHHTDMEVEWENASLMDEGDGFQRIWGAVPEFVWPAVGDRVLVAGRWIFDCGHPGADDPKLVQFGTEIHPPRALVTFRLNHPALDSFPYPRISAPNFPGVQSYLPVTGVPTSLPPGVPNTGPTGLPVTEADIFISGHGGAANDVCSLQAAPSGNLLPPCTDHTGPVIPINDTNYAFDIYPPGTAYGTLVNGTFLVTPPVPDASLQWRVVDHSSELPTLPCGSSYPNCATIDPIFCPIDASIPPLPQDPTLVTTTCPAPPAPPAQPTRLRVILPFAGSQAIYFAQSILLGWDDVPAPPNTLAVRTFQVTLHKLTIVKNGESIIPGDWRVFVNVGGQYRYMGAFPPADSTGDCNHHGVFTEDSLTGNKDDECFNFDAYPWTVSVQQGTPIHVAVGGWESDDIDSDFCRSYPGCDFNLGSYLTLGRANNDRIGTYEFDLTDNESLENYSLGYTPPPPFTTQNTGDNCTLPFPFTCDELQYSTEFQVREIPLPLPPASAPLLIGLPNFTGSAGIYISPSTPLIPQTADNTVEGFQYRFHKQGGPLPTYPFFPLEPYPVHWTHVDLLPGVHSAAVTIGGANMGDGPYDFQYSAQNFAQLLEPRHTTTVSLDGTPPVITITKPASTTYTHSATLTLYYSADDGTGSGLASLTPTMDGAATLLGGVGLQNGQPIKLLTELSLGSHVFTVAAADNVGNTSNSSVNFTIIVNPRSIEDDVRQFLQSGAIHHEGLADSLLNKLEEGAKAQARGQCTRAARIYRTFIEELQDQSGKGVDTAASAIMIADAQYLIAHCP